MSTPDALADRLVTEGRLSEAIKVLTDANRAARDAKVETRLVELRRDACARIAGSPVARSKGARSWPPRVRDRFRGVDGVPEVSAAELTPKLLRSAVLRHGCLLVRGLIPHPRVDQIVDDIDRAMAAYDAAAHGATVAETAPWFVPIDPGPGDEVPRHWIREGGGVLAVDSPRLLFDVIEVFEEAGIGDLVAGFLGERPVILAKKWTLRRVSAAERGAELSDTPPDWHQDGAFMGADIRSLDVWVSLSHCGDDAPGLDVVARRFDELVDTGTEGANFDWSVGHPLVERVASGMIVRPVFEPGDALLFDHLMLHRTGIDEEMTRTRYAIEAWFAAPSSYPADQLPIAY